MVPGLELNGFKLKKKHVIQKCISSILQNKVLCFGKIYEEGLSHLMRDTSVKYHSHFNLRHR